ncbi:MAG TPA: hypothetical protein VLG28_10005 [Acidimicrobiia bacterium]|nr:hypothetical protein [Acidimicrobiia bacterium]
MRPERPRSLLATTILTAVVCVGSLSACTNDDALPVPAPVEVETCDELIEVSVQLVDVWLEVLAELPVEQLMADAPPPEFAELAAIGDDLDDRAGRLGCDPAAMNAAVASELQDRDDLEAGDVVSQLLLDIVRGGIVGDLPPVPSTTEGSS